MINQGTRNRYCGYCGLVYNMDFIEWNCHVQVCERKMAQWYRKTQGKTPYNETDGEIMEGGCK